MRFVAGQPDALAAVVEQDPVGRVVQNILYQRHGQDFPQSRPNPLDLTTRPELAEYTIDVPDLAEYDHLTNLEDDCDHDANDR